ncbi:MAG: hypothetical protein ACP5RT_00375 [Candidatus Micrarchaeia archaeon]
MRAQSAIEFLSTYAWAFIITTLFVAIVLVFVVFKNPQEYTPSSCYLSPELLCIQSLFYTNSVSSNFSIMFINNMGAPLVIPANAITVYLPYSSPSSGYSYIGGCLPSSIPNGGYAICTAHISKSFLVGSQINLYFNLRYSVCTGSLCQNLNSTGTSSGIAFYSKSIFSNLTLLTSPTSSNIVINGVSYPNKAVVPVINNMRYEIYGQPVPTYYTFNSWVPSNVFVGNTLQQYTTIYLTQNGTIEAKFTP